MRTVKSSGVEIDKREEFPGEEKSTSASRPRALSNMDENGEKSRC
jgi:hypothetical protein